MRAASSFARSLVSCLLLHIGAAGAAGRTHALLVGVSQYPNLDQALWLDGPRNDVQMYAAFLESRGVAKADISVLADGVPGAGDPTHKAILGALDAIAARVRPGDLAVLMFAGHGSQQPAMAEDLKNETDGLDEIFLPRDIGQWNREMGALPNALTDNELGEAIGRIRDRGAFVWAVFDNCHSGTITRAMPVPGEKDRQVKPQALGIDPSVLAAAAGRAASVTERTRGGGGTAELGLELARDGQKSNRGGFVAFYAAQSQETTPEAALPRYSPDAVTRGLFSYTLYQVLSAHPDATYRQAIEQVLQSYQGMSRQQPTPTYEGTGLDNVVLGAGSGISVVQWRVDEESGGMRLRAGLIQQVTRDSILAVVPAPTSKDSEVLGYVKVTGATSTESDVEPIAYGDKPALDVAKIGMPSFARPVDLKVDFLLRVSAPAQSAVCEAPSAPLAAAIRGLQSAKGIAQRVRWVGAAEQADVRLCQSGGRLLFLDGSGSLPADPRWQEPGIDLRGAASAGNGDALSPLAIEIGTSLEKIGRVANLARLAAGVGGPGKIEIEVKWLPKCDSARPDCSAEPQLLGPTTRPTVRDGDRVRIALNNPLPQPVDVTVLYVDAFYGISTLFPNPDESPRIEPRGQKEIQVTLNANPAGFEQMLVIAVPAAPQSPPTSFAGLAQKSIAPASTRGGSSGGLLDLFEEAAFGAGGVGTTRGPPRREGTPTGSAEFMTFAWTVVPR